MTNQTNQPAARGPVKLPGWLTFPKDRRQWIWLAVRAALFAAVLVLFFQHPGFYTKTNKAGIVFYKKKFILQILGISALGILLPCLRLKLPVWLRIPIAFVEALGIPLLALVRAEEIHKNQFFGITPICIWFNILLAAAIFLVFHLITNRIRWSAMLTYVVILGFSILNYYVNIFRGEPINAADIYVAGTALNVAADYTFTVKKVMWQSLFGSVILLAILNWLPPEELYLRGKKRLIYAPAALCAAAAVFYVFTVSDYPLDKGVQCKVFRPMDSYKANGEMLNFFRGFYYMIVDEPDGYSNKHAQAMMQDSGYVSDAADADDGTQNPNIIIVMNESLTDYSGYAAMETSADPLPFIHSLQRSGADNVITGDLHTDVFGGRTANSEYEVLTGNSVAFLPYNAVPYALYVRRHTPSVTWNLRDIGYAGNYAFHPYKANGYSRPRAYPNLGFEEFISIETIQEQLTDADYVRNRVSDLANFRIITELYEASKKESDAPFFLYNVTMQNHGGFTVDYDNLPMDITISGALAYNEGARRYLNLTHCSDEAFRWLTEYFSQTDDPTVLVMFGDHQPNLHDDFYPNLYGKAVKDLDDYELFGRYETPLVVWANYDINPGGKYSSAFEEISINYLSSVLMQAAGVPMTAYQKFMADMQQEIPVFTAHGYLDASGQFYEVMDETSPYYDLVQEYFTYSYNYQFGGNGRGEEFFRLECEEHAIDREDD